ncbi:MAG TPA: PTS sugar transporter subunit IIA, partial [Candidatus Cloacimonadota bacterium]|nr:PTS sugar transporter subunit IIA [Candidatus Cloacimonadota bacterium]
PGGQMHIVVGMLAYSSGLISEKIFVSIVASAILTTIIFGPWLSQAVRKLRKAIFEIIFTESEIYMDVSAQTQEEMLKFMSQVVAEQTNHTEEAVYREIKLREDQMSTAMGGGIAIPHARLEGIDKSYLFVFRSNHGLEWDSPDGKPAHLILLVITPKSSPNAQIQILQSLATALHDRQIARQLVRTKDQRYLWAALRSELNACQHCNVNQA